MALAQAGNMALAPRRRERLDLSAFADVINAFMDCRLFGAPR